MTIEVKSFSNFLLEELLDDLPKELMDWRKDFQLLLSDPPLTGSTPLS